MTSQLPRWNVGKAHPSPPKRSRTITGFCIAAALIITITSLCLHGGSEHLNRLSSSLTSHVSSPPSPPSPPPPSPPTHSDYDEDSLVVHPPPPVTAQQDVSKDLKVFELPDLDDFTVRGVKVSEFLERPPLYPLLPFPDSPMPSNQEDGKRNAWLGAVIVGAFDVQRRMMIRYSWMSLYKDVPMDMRFVIANPGPAWTEVIRQENRTYGDMIILEKIQEDDFTANTIKTIELFRYLSEDSPRKYEIVTKIDTDLWVDARKMYNRKIRPLLSEDGKRAIVDRTFIGQFYYEPRFELVLPHGAFYTVTWDIVQLLPKLHKQYGVIRNEDMLVAWLLVLAKERVNFIVLSQAEKFNFNKADTRGGTAWAREDTDTSALGHALYGKDVIAVHRLKTDEDWLLIAECFDEHGIKDPPADLEAATGDRPKYYPPWFKNVPEDHWEIDEAGRVLVNGVWTLEPGVNKDLERPKEQH